MAAATATIKSSAGAAAGLPSFLAGLLGRRAGGRSAIGIDPGTRSVKVIQLERPDPAGRPRVVAAAVVPRAGDGTGVDAVTAGEAAAVVAALAPAGVRGRRAVVAAPGGAVMVGPLELPPRNSAAPLDQIARMEVARNFRCPPDSFEMAWWEMPAGIRGGRGTHALAVGLPHADADALIDAFARRPAGLDVEAVDAGPAALARACRPALSTAGVTAILDLGQGPATLSFVHQDVLTFSRRIPDAAAGPLRESLCRALSVEADVADYLLGEVGLVNRAPRADDGDAAAVMADGDDGGGDNGDGDGPVDLPDVGRRLVAAFADALVKELTLSFSYASHQYPDAVVSKLLLVGGGAGMAGLASRLSSALGVETVRVAPADLAECDASVLALCSSPAMTLALGLALREYK